jgi:hypothetical protein
MLYCDPNEQSRKWLTDGIGTGMLTFAVEKELNIVYFDGSSAANSVSGHQDSQDLVIYGKVRPDKVMAEWERIVRFCEWGAKFNIDAIVR